MTENQPVQQPRWEGPGQKVYANVAAVNGGPFDVTVVFGLQQSEVPAQPGQEPRIEEVVRVSMSWAHAKSLIPLLARVVADYESKMGQVPSPGFDDQWKG